MREEDTKGGEDVDQENNRSDNNTSESHPPANDSQQSLEEADNIVQDALQLAENDELNEYRDVSSPPVLHIHMLTTIFFLVHTIPSLRLMEHRTRSQRSADRKVPYPLNSLLLLMCATTCYAGTVC